MDFVRLCSAGSVFAQNYSLGSIFQQYNGQTYTLVFIGCE